MRDFEIRLPADVSPEDAAALREEIEALNGVEGTTKTRGLDINSASMIVQTAATAAGVLVPIVVQIAGLFKKQGVQGARITLPNGTVIEAGDSSPEELQALIQAAGGA